MTIIKIKVKLTINSKLLNIYPLLEQILYIYFSMRSKKVQTKTQILIDFNNKVHVMIPVYAKKLGF